MTERNYYTKFKQSYDQPLLKYFSKLDLEDWIAFFDDYYRHNLTFLLRILDTPKGEDIYSYGLIWVNNVDSATRELIARGNDKLLSNYIVENDSDLLEETFKAIRYLKLDVSKDFLAQIISNKEGKPKLRELAAITLITVHENSATTIWDQLDLGKDQFLIPSYIAFNRKNNPVKGLEKLRLLQHRPENIAAFETPTVYSLLQISTSTSIVEQYQFLQKTFPAWVNSFIKELFDDYPELDALKEKLQRPFEDILEKIDLDQSVWDDLEGDAMSIELKNSQKVLRSSLNILLKELKEKPELIEVANQKEITIIDPSYIQQLDSIFLSLKTELKKLGIGNINDPSNEQVFEATENIFLYDQPVIFLYPYFLDDYRMYKRGAGVIKYAVQKSMSIVIHKHNPLYYKWCALRDAAKDFMESSTYSIFEDRELDRAITLKESEDWLVELIQHLYKHSGKIYSIRGYVFDSLIQQFAKKHIPSNENKKMIEVLKNSIDIGSINNKEIPFYRQHEAKENISKNEILLLDPADALKSSKNGLSKELNQLNQSYYDVVTIKHGLDISVGIGFSLFALPRLLKNKKWKILQDLIIEKLQPEKNLLMNVGIEVFKMESKAIKENNTITV